MPITNMRRGTIAVAFATLWMIAGCGDAELNLRYGEFSGEGASSVNGTSVLGDLFEQAGHSVSPAYSLTPKIAARADTIVWFPDSFEPPADNVYAWFDHWLAAESGRTLVYVGRDYDAALTYWRTLAPTLPKESEEAREMRIASVGLERSLAGKRQAAKSAGQRQATHFDDFENWFEVEFREQFKPVRALSGDPAWFQQIDAQRSEIELATVLKPLGGGRTLLETDDGDALVSEVEWRGGRIIVVANGSFLLNLPLVNHEHRKLAGRLIDSIETTSGSVVFLESGPNGPRVSESDSAHRTGLELFTEFPFDWILLHLAIPGVIFGFARWPRFGFVRPWIVDTASDFGQHIIALGRLLQATRNRSFAEERLRQYQQSRSTGSRGKSDAAARSALGGTQRSASLHP